MKPTGRKGFRSPAPADVALGFLSFTLFDPVCGVSTDTNCSLAPHPGTPSASNLGFKAWGGAGLGCREPPAHSGFGGGMPLWQPGGEETRWAGPGWSQAVGGKCQLSRAPGSGHGIARTGRDWQGDWERDPGTQASSSLPFPHSGLPLPMLISSPTPLARVSSFSSFPSFLLRRVCPILYVFTLFLFHLLTV